MTDANADRAILDSRSLVFVMGAARSGTTWLQELLSQSPKVVSTPETHLFDYYLGSLERTWARYDRYQTRLPRFMDRDRYVDACRLLADRVFADLARTRPEAAIVLEKTPNHAWMWRFIDALYPRAHLVFTIRDPRAVAASYRAASRTWAKRWAGIGGMEVARLWVRVAEAARSAREERANVQIVKYEDLLADPEAGLAAVFAGLGHPIDASTAHDYVEACKPEAMRQRMMARGSQQAYVQNFIRKARSDSWREELKPRHVATVESVAGHLMPAFGYECVTAGRAPVPAFVDRAVDSFRWRTNRVAKRVKQLL